MEKMMAKQKYVRVTTPTGTARYPWLNKPDTKWKEEGEYKVDLVLSKKDAKALADRITSVRDEFYKSEGKAAKKKASLPFADEKDDNDKPTGNVVFKFRVKAKTGDWDRKPKLFDAKGHIIKNAPSIGGGTSMKVSFDIYPWNVASLGVGVTLQPVAAQIIDLVEYDGGGDASDYGFGEEEGFETEDDLEETVGETEESEDEDVF